MATLAPRRPPILNLPNALTLGRLLLSVVLFVCIAYGWWAAGLVVFCLAAVTDWLDGYLARVQGLTSAFGRNFDPLVDKVLISGAFIFLLPVPGARLAPWMVTVVVGRELIITGLRGFMETTGAVFGADRLGKLKMVLQCAFLIAILLELSAGPAAIGGWLGALNVGLLYAMIGATILSGGQYVWRAAVLLKEG